MSRGAETLRQKAHAAMVEACDREIREQLAARAPVAKMCIVLRNWSLSQLTPLKLVQGAS